MIASWQSITSEQDFFDLIERSDLQPQIIFKDSTTCGISAHAKERLIHNFDLLEGKADFNYLDLLSYRSISNLIAQELQVTHQSPQIIVLKHKRVVHSVSHHAIQAADIVQYL